MSYGYRGWHVGFTFDDPQSNAPIQRIYEAPPGRKIVNAQPSEDERSLIVTLDDGTTQTVMLSAPADQTVH